MISLELIKKSKSPWNIWKIWGSFIEIDMLILSSSLSRMMISRLLILRLDLINSLRLFRRPGRRKYRLMLIHISRGDFQILNIESNISVKNISNLALRVAFSNNIVIILIRIIKLMISKIKIKLYLSNNLKFIRDIKI